MAAPYFAQNGEKLDLLFENVDMSFQDAFNAQQPWAERVASRISSSSRTTVFPIREAPATRLRVWDGERVMNRMKVRPYSVTNKPWELSYEVDEDDLDDDQYGVYGDHAAVLGSASRLWPNDLVWPCFQEGRTRLCYDGQPMFSAAHPINIDEPGMGLFSNYYTNKPLTHDNWMQVSENFMMVKGPDGEELEMVPDAVAVGPQLKHKAMQLFNASITAPAGGAGANSTDSQDNILEGEATVFVIAKLGRIPGAWFPLFTKSKLKPFFFQVRREPRLIIQRDPQQPRVFKDKNIAFGVDARGAGGFYYPHMAAMCIPGAS